MAQEGPLAAAQHLSPVWPHYTDILVDHAAGIYLYDVAGRRYTDFTCGIAVTNTGHCHPRVVQAAQEQCARLIHGQANILYHQPMLRLAEELRTVVPEGLDSFFFSNSGAEAIEAAVKLARHATGRPGIVVFQGSFHGRTVGTMSLTTSKTVYRLRYQPLMAGVAVAPYPYAYRYGWPAERTSQFCLEELRHLLLTQSDPSETAAFLVEPVLGEGGYVVPPKSFLAGLRAIADEHGILLIVDEIQSGFGRTGKWFACEHAGVRPDIMAMAKGIASGFPLSGIAAPRTLMEKWAPGSHGGTYGGNAVACAAGVATIQTLREEKLVANSARQGRFLLGRLREMQKHHPRLGDVRGAGLMVGVEFTGADGRPDKAVAKAVRLECQNRGLLLLTCGPYDNVIRWMPPLVVTRAQIAEALAAFEEALQAAGA